MKDNEFLVKVVQTPYGLAIDIPTEFFNSYILKDGEVLKWKVEDDEVTITRTHIIDPEGE